MVALRRVAALLALSTGLLSLATHAAGAGDHIARIRLTGVIDQVNAAYIGEALKSAADNHAAAAIIQIDSPGGELTSMDNMLQAILASPIPVITWVAPEGAGAGSAATFITLAGDVAAMAPSTSIGAAAVVGSNNLPLLVLGYVAGPRLLDGGSRRLWHRVRRPPGRRGSPQQQRIQPAFLLP